MPFGGQPRAKARAASQARAELKAVEQRPVNDREGAPRVVHSLIPSTRPHINNRGSGVFRAVSCRGQAGRDGWFRGQTGVKTAVRVTHETLKAPETLGHMVELRGFEPLTPSMRTRCATRLRHNPSRTGEPDRR